MKNIFLPLITIAISIAAAWCTAGYAFRAQYKGGKIQLLDIIIRYYIVVINVFDKSTKKISENKIDQKIYVNGIKIIGEDLRVLITNPYFNKLIEKNPKISKLLVLLQRDNVIIENSEFLVNNKIYKEFSEIFDYISNELPKKYLSKNEFYKEICNTKKILDIENK
jgi:hypothetical protein